MSLRSSGPISSFAASNSLSVVSGESLRPMMESTSASMYLPRPISPPNQTAFASARSPVSNIWKCVLFVTP